MLVEVRVGASRSEGLACRALGQAHRVEKRLAHLPAQVFVAFAGVADVAVGNLSSAPIKVAASCVGRIIWGPLKKGK